MFRRFRPAQLRGVLGWVALGALASASFALLAPGCIARGHPLPDRQTDDDAGPAIIEAGVVDPGEVPGDAPAPDPHSILAVDPPHGPFSGGQLATIRGTGFAGAVRVWLGPNEVDPTEVVPVDPTRIQVTVPPGSAGPVDVTVRNGDDESTSRTLPNAYVYDAYLLTPSAGPTSGGTVVTLHGDHTAWDPETEVFINLAPCTDVAVLSDTELSCVTPSGATGSQAVRVRTGDGIDSDVLDAFTYVDSDNGFRGGLSGDPLDDQLTVLVLDNFTGQPLAGATVVLDDDLSTAREANAAGLVTYSGEPLGPTRTVTVAKPCSQPITFVNVGVDTVTAYLDPVLSPLCGEGGDPPSTGSVSTNSGSLEGELVWRSSVEFTRQGWTNVPSPASAGDTHVAYVFQPNSSPDADFSLPAASRAITPDADGTVGYEFSLSALPGNQTLYALAGIENRDADPPIFIAYAMGVVQGAVSEPGETTEEVFIPINTPLDQVVTLQVDGPTPTSRGPDRVNVGVSVQLGEAGYAIFPIGSRSQLLPVSSEMSFVGLPPLDGPLLGNQYVITASASTGVAELAPRSVLGVMSRHTSAGVVDVSDFVEVPILVSPPTGEIWNGRQLSVDWAPGGPEPTVCVFDIQSGAALVTWTVAAPAGVRDVALPALAEIDPELGLIAGPIDVVVTLAQIRDFDYGALRYRHLASRGWDAYARDTYATRYAP